MHLGELYSKGKLKWEQAVGGGKKHSARQVKTRAASSGSIKSRQPYSNMTTTALLYPASTSALPLVQAVCQPLIRIQAATVLVQEEVVVLRERVALRVVG